MRAKRTAQLRVDHEQHAGRSQRFGVKFMESHVAGGGRQKKRRRKKECRTAGQPEPQPDAKPHRRHRPESRVLEYDKNHRMPEHKEEWRQHKNDRFDMVAEEWHAFERAFETAVDELPNGLHIIGEIERPVTKIGPPDI